MGLDEHMFGPPPGEDFPDDADDDEVHPRTVLHDTEDDGDFDPWPRPWGLSQSGSLMAFLVGSVFAMALLVGVNRLADDNATLAITRMAGLLIALGLTLPMLISFRGTRYWKVMLIGFLVVSVSAVMSLAVPGDFVTPECKLSYSKSDMERLGRTPDELTDLLQNRSEDDHLLILKVEGAENPVRVHVDENGDFLNLTLNHRGRGGRDGENHFRTNSKDYYQYDIDLVKTQEYIVRRVRNKLALSPVEVDRVDVVYPWDTG